MEQDIKNLYISGLVSATDNKPYVLVSIGDEQLQITIAQARKIAADIVQSAARYEADAMIYKFFKEENFPMGAAIALMMQFRELRAKLDAEEVESFQSEPVNPEEKK